MNVPGIETPTNVSRLSRVDIPGFATTVDGVSDDAGLPPIGTISTGAGGALRRGFEIHACPDPRGTLVAMGDGGRRRGAARAETTRSH
jgi:hypothetical protein